MQSLCRCNKRTGLFGPANHPFHVPPYRADNGNLGNFKVFDRNGTVFAPMQCLYQKVATDMENLNMQSLCRCNKRTGLYWPENYPVSCTAV